MPLKTKRITGTLIIQPRAQAAAGIKCPLKIKVEFPNEELKGRDILAAMFAVEFAVNSHASQVMGRGIRLHLFEEIE